MLTERTRDNPSHLPTSSNDRRVLAARVQIQYTMTALGPLPAKDIGNDA